MSKQSNRAEWPDGAAVLRRRSSVDAESPRRDDPPEERPPMVWTRTGNSASGAHAADERRSTNLSDEQDSMALNEKVPARHRGGGGQASSSDRRCAHGLTSHSTRRWKLQRRAHPARIPATILTAGSKNIAVLPRSSRACTAAFDGGARTAQLLLLTIRTALFRMHRAQCAAGGGVRRGGPRPVTDIDEGSL